MVASIIRRLFQGFFVLFILTVILFFGIMAAGDPLEFFVSDSLNENDRNEIRKNLGLDKPVYIQYFYFVKNSLMGDFGKSFATGESTQSMIFERLGATLELVLVAFFIAFFVGILVGIYAGMKPKSKLSSFLMSLILLFFSIPAFWIMIVAIMLFSVNLGWLPPGRRGDIGVFLGIHSSLLTLDGIRHVILPSVTMSLVPMSLIARLVRASVMEITRADYIVYARAKGLSMFTIARKHIFKNISLPLVTISGMELGNMVAFAVLVETIFNWPGVGKLLISSIYAMDRPLILTQLVFTSIMFILINLAVDILYVFLDPRVKDSVHSRGK